MKWEYLIFNALVVLGPLALSFDRRVHFVSRWRNALMALTPPLVVYIIWDALVAGRHWWFNEAYTLDVRLLGLPPGEWLFFVTVPFACLFVWECLGAYFANPRYPALAQIRRLLYIGLPVGLWLFSIGLEYTGLVCIALAGVGFLDEGLGTDLFSQRKTWVFLAIVTGLTAVCNGYLTARPVVLYGEAYQLGLRIITVPVEDYGYGISLLLYCVLGYEWLRRRQNATEATAPAVSS